MGSLATGDAAAPAVRTAGVGQSGARAVPVAASLSRGDATEAASPRGGVGVTLGPQANGGEGGSAAGSHGDGSACMHRESAAVVAAAPWPAAAVGGSSTTIAACSRASGARIGDVGRHSAWAVPVPAARADGERVAGPYGSGASGASWLRACG